HLEAVRWESLQDSGLVPDVVTIGTTPLRPIVSAHDAGPQQQQAKGPNGLKANWAFYGHGDIPHCGRFTQAKSPPNAHHQCCLVPQGTFISYVSWFRRRPPFVLPLFSKISPKSHDIFADILGRNSHDRRQQHQHLPEDLQTSKTMKPPFLSRRTFLKSGAAT